MGVQAQGDALHGSTGWLLLQVDLKNAFTSIARPAILEALERQFQSMKPWVRQAFQPAPLLIGREVIWSTRGGQQGDPLGPFLFAAGIHAALGALPPWDTMHRWYPDDGVFMGSVVEVEGVLAALQQALTPPGPGAEHAEDQNVGPGTGPHNVPPCSRYTLPPGRGHGGAGSTDPLFPLPLAGGGPPGHTEGEFASTCAAVAALADIQCAHALMRSCLGPAKVQYALRTLPVRHTAVFAADVTATQRATWDAVVGTSTFDKAWVQTTLPMSECSCGVASAADVAPVARLAGIMQFLARAEPMLGSDRQLCRAPGHRGGAAGRP